MGLSIWQILIIVAVILLLFGGRKIPGLMRDMGSGITQFRKGLKGDQEEGETAANQTAEKRTIEGEKATTTAGSSAGSASGATKDEANKV